MPRRRTFLGFGVALAALFAAGVFASVGLTSPPCQAKHGTCASPTPTTTSATTTDSTATTNSTTTAAPTTTATTTTTTTTASAPVTTTTTTATTTAATNTTTTTTTTAAAPTVVDQYVSPEGATILVYSDAVGGWTAQSVYNLLKPNAYQLPLIGPMLTVKVTGQYASSESSGVSGTAGSYSNYHATIYLQASSNSSFTATPDAVVAHEYGHAWSLYHLYMTEQGDWTSYLAARGLTGNSLLGSSYMWMTTEILAEDYRLSFGTSTAQNESPQMNYQLPDARTVSGLKTFLANNW